MIENSVQLIHRILDGEEEAFTELVQKYQKKIHALAWRKIGDYHVAEEITQDIFFQVYKKLPTLKNPILFEGWLYVVTNRLCLNWIKKNKVERSHLSIQSLEDTPPKEIIDSFYTLHQIEQREKEKVEHYQEIVKKLLEILPESERTVITLYYLGEMTAQEISKFLGVSVNTIKSKLRRARNRLKTEEEHLLNENLGGLQLSTDLSENILRQIADIKPTPQVVKPIFPWAALGAAVVLVLLLFGTMDRFTSHFQMPYDFAAPSKPTIELVESPINIDIISNPIPQNRFVIGEPDNNSEGVGRAVPDADLAVNVLDNTINTSLGEWTQANGPHGSSQYKIFATTDNEIYAISQTRLYRLSQDGTTWMDINANILSDMYQAPITDYQGVIYSVNTNEIYASTDNGESWNIFCTRPTGDVVGLIITGHTQENLLMYLAFKDKGVFHSVDGGRNWLPLNNGLMSKTIYTVAKIGDSVLIGTNQGLYRLNLEVWTQLPVDPLRTVHSIEVFENDLYVVTGGAYHSHDFLITEVHSKTPRKIFHSANSGASWHEITPTDKSFNMAPVFKGPTEIYAVDKTLWVLGAQSFRSVDGGQIWKNIGMDINLRPSPYSSVLTVNKNTFYKVGPVGIIRTTDGGDSLHTFTKGTINTKVRDLVAFNRTLYVYTGIKFFKSVDDSNSWEEVHIDYNMFTPTRTDNKGQPVHYFVDARLEIINNELYVFAPRYAMAPGSIELHIYRLRLDDGAFLLVNKLVSPKQWKGTEISDLPRLARFGGSAVSGETIYIEFKGSLYKCTPNSVDVIDTDLADTGIPINGELDRGIKIAVSAEVVYVGKRDGRLHQSIDAGNSWRDITPTIPSSFSHIMDIAFVGSKVYVATDKGVLTSETGEHWRMLTDHHGKSIIMDRFAMTEFNFYGAGDMGIYSLDSGGQWQQISANIPGKVISLSANRDKLYICTDKRGIFHISLEQ